MKKLMESWRKLTGLINEATLTRVKQKINDPEYDRQAFVIISADRHEYSGKENLRRFGQLKAEVDLHGFPHSDLVGSWIEKDEDTGAQHQVTENSIIIYDEERPDAPRDMDLFEMGKELSFKYEQEAFIFGELGSTSGRMIINAFNAEGSPVDYGGPWSSVEEVSSDADFWSKVRGQRDAAWAFKEGKETEKEVLEVDAPNSTIGAMILANKHKSRKIKFVRKRNN